MSSSQAPTTERHSRRLPPVLFVDIAGTTIVFLLVTQLFPGLPTFAASAIAALVPIFSCIITFLQKRRAEVLGIIVMAGFLIGTIAALLGLDKLLLFPLITGSFSIMFLGSLLFPRPLAFYLGRELVSRNDPGRIAQFNDLWQYPDARSAFKLMTITWGLVTLLEFILQLLLFLQLPTSLFAIISPLLKVAVYVAILIWTILFARHRQIIPLGSAQVSVQPQS